MANRASSNRPDLAQVLTERRDQIIACLIAEVDGTGVSPPGLSRPLLVDHIPRYLDEICAALNQLEQARASKGAGRTSSVARKHGEQRWSLGYDLEGLLREFGILRSCVVQAARDARVAISLDEYDVLSKCLNVGVAEAVKEYGKFRDEQVEAHKADLEFLAAAGELLSSSLDYRSTLSRLASLVVPRMADCCAVYLEGQDPGEMQLAHVDPAKVELLRNIYARFPLPSDSPERHRSVARTGKPEIHYVVEPGFFEAIAQNSEHLALLLKLNVGSWMTVPLAIQGHTFGALTFVYSDSGRRYQDQDLTLALELARRAAVAVDNARLYDLSQKERSRVEAATRAKDEFVAMLSHELRTPLNAILGWTRLMREGKVPESEREQALAVVERNANAQNQLIGDLFDISKVTTGEIRIEPTEVDLVNLVTLAIESVQPTAGAKDIRIIAHLAATDARMRGDGRRLQQVVWNLLANAVKFTPRNGTVEVGVRREGSALELTVQDNGDGISADFLPFVFDSFRQSDSSVTRRHGGLGLGLSIARHIIQLHGGTIEARSPGIGAGATFVVRLPVDLSRASQAPVPATLTLQAGGSVPTNLHLGIRVLVVDDDEDARDLVAYALQTTGMELRVAASAPEALAELESYVPHVIVSDIGMPLEDGYSLIRRIRTLPSTDKSSIPAIALTAFGRNEDRTRALVAGFNLHLTKPVEPSALIRAVVELAGPVRH
jgi:signal transduction histidine kinase/CheY-like chemotaxis protein